MLSISRDKNKKYMFNFVIPEKLACVGCETEEEQFFLQLEGMVEDWAHPLIFVAVHWGAETSEEAEHDFIKGK